MPAATNTLQGTDKYSVNVPQDAEDVVLSGGAGVPHNFTLQPRAIWVGTGGTIIASYVAKPTTFHTLINVPDGTLLLGAFASIKSTTDGTTAASIVGMI